MNPCVVRFGFWVFHIPIKERTNSDCFVGCEDTCHCELKREKEEKKSILISTLSVSELLPKGQGDKWASIYFLLLQEAAIPQPLFFDSASVNAFVSHNSAGFRLRGKSSGAILLYQCSWLVWWVKIRLNVHKHWQPLFVFTNNPFPSLSILPCPENWGRCRNLFFVLGY